MINPEKLFSNELEVFRTEAGSAIQFFYSWLTVHAVAGEHKAVHRLLNRAPLFWNTMLGGLQTSTFIALGRVFDQQSKHNVDRLLKIAQSNMVIFSKEALAGRKRARGKWVKNGGQKMGDTSLFIVGMISGTQPVAGVPTAKRPAWFSERRFSGGSANRWTRKVS